MTVEEFEKIIESYKREYLTIVKKIGADHIWMAPNKGDWYHSQYFVIDVKRNSSSGQDVDLTFAVNDASIANPVMIANLQLLKTYIQKENFKYSSIQDAKNKFKEISDKFPFVKAEKESKVIYMDRDSKINNIDVGFSPAIIKQPQPVLPVANNSEAEKIFGDLHLNNEIKASFYNGLKSKGFVILAGISGIGKTKIFENFVRHFVSQTAKDNFVFVSIRPDFRDTKSLLGYYNPLSEEYQITPLLELLIRANDDLKTPHFVLFDEMNLARVEYYFADFLSVLESQRDINGYTTQSIQLHNSMSDKVRQQRVPRDMKISPNVYFIGSVNIDETTHMFSPKVIDRAFTIEFDVGSFKKYTEFLEDRLVEDYTLSADFKKLMKKDFINQGKYTVIKKDENFVDTALLHFDDLENLNLILPKHLRFGYRVFDEIIAFIINSRESVIKFNDDNEAFDIAIKMKILPKFHGTRDKLETIFDNLSNFAERKKWNHTLKKINSMRENIISMGYTSFM